MTVIRSWAGNCGDLPAEIGTVADRRAFCGWKRLGCGEMGPVTVVLCVAFAMRKSMMEKDIFPATKPRDMSMITPVSGLLLSVPQASIVLV
jgi:hypothetical protein